MIKFDVATGLTLTQKIKVSISIGLVWIWNLCKTSLFRYKVTLCFKLALNKIYDFQMKGRISHHKSFKFSGQFISKNLKLSKFNSNSLTIFNRGTRFLVYRILAIIMCRLKWINSFLDLLFWCNNIKLKQIFWTYCKWQETFRKAIPLQEIWKVISLSVK